MTAREERLRKNLEEMEARDRLREQVRVLKAKGYSNSGIAERMEISENTVRSMLRKRKP